MSLLEHDERAHLEHDWPIRPASLQQTRQFSRLHQLCLRNRHGAQTDSPDTENCARCPPHNREAHAQNMQERKQSLMNILQRINNSVE